MTPTPNLLADALRELTERWKCDGLIASEIHANEVTAILAAHDAATHASAQQDEGYPGIAHDFETAKTQLRAAQYFFESPRSFSQEEFREVGRVVMGAKEYTGRLPDCVPEKTIDPFDEQQAGTRVVTDADVERGLHDWYRGDVWCTECTYEESDRVDMRRCLESFAATLAQPTRDGAQQGEPVAWRLQDGHSIVLYDDEDEAKRDVDHARPHSMLMILEPLYLHPAPSSVPAQGEVSCPRCRTIGEAVRALVAKWRARSVAYAESYGFASDKIAELVEELEAALGRELAGQGRED